MAKQLNIDVNLNTAKATQQLQALQQALTQAIQGAAGSGNGALTKEIVKATEAAVKLKTILSQSMNTDTGNLDLSKFSQQLAKNKVSLQDYARQLTALGPHGEKAFMQMSKAIVSAETPMRQSSKLMNNLWTTMKNTARWQISSAALHTFIGGLQSAMSYARGLNDSLNSIRIVTGQSTQEMDAFAQRANKSAKELSASTLDYTDAALIYYQQGIRDQQQIKERTDATIKMSNVTGESASKVSEELTAIWNNFADGSKNLEYYADVITALGANTASSSKEIAQGLSKFAAVADTVGLSYEYATSALATIVATTRQSADVVGTALKTLFARIQDLDLGKTLDDGTTLGKYSAALDAVGIAIKDQHGELRNMDDILDDMGSKWTTLSKDQQVALAQTVAGTRQYTQLVALMDNWDFMKENLMVAKGSEGELQKQADIYAESWKAAKDRVKASMQGIYDDLISDKFFIGLNNTLATALSGLDKFIDAIGGIPGVLGLVGIALTTVFKDQFGRVIEDNIQRLRVMSGIATQQANATRQQAIDAANKFTSQNAGSTAMQMETNALRTQLELADALQQKKQEMVATGDKIAQADLNEINALMQVLELQQEIGIAAQKELESAEETANAKQLNLRANLMTMATQQGLNQKLSESAAIAQAGAVVNKTMADVGQLSNLSAAVSTLKSGLESVATSTEAVSETTRPATAGINALAEAFEVLAKASLLTKTDLRDIDATLSKSAGKIAEINAELAQLQEKGGLLYNRNGQAKKRSSYSKSDSIAAFDEAKQREKELLENQAFWQNKQSNAQLYQQAKQVQQLQEQALKAGTPAARQAADQAAQAFFNEFKNKFSGGQLDQILDQAIGNIKANNALLKGKEIAAIVEEGIKTGKLRFTAANVDTSEAETAIKERIQNASKEAFSNTTQNATKALQGLSSFAMGLSSISSAVKALNNEDLSFFEKFTQVSMSLGIGLPMLISGFANMATSLKALKGGFTNFINTMLLAKTASLAGAAALGTVEIAQTSLLGKTGMLIAAKLGLAKAERVYKRVQISPTQYSVEAFQILRLKTATKLLTDAKAKLAAMSAKDANVLFGMNLPQILALIAAIMVLSKLIKSIKADIEAASPEGQLNKAKETASELKTNLDNAKQAAEDLKAAFDKYQSAQDALKNCAEGTKEWTDALREANLATLELLSNYPELSKYIKTAEDGSKYISDEGKQVVETQAQDRVTTAQLAYNAANQNVRELTTQSQLRDWASQMTGNQDVQHVLIDNIDQIAQMQPGQERIEGIRQLLQENGIGYGENTFAPSIDGLLTESSTLTSQMNNLANEVTANSQAVETENDIMAETALSNNEIIQNSKNNAQIAKAISTDLPKNFQEAKKSYMDDFAKGTWVKENEANYQKYLKDNNIQASNLQVQGNRATYDDKDGQQQTLSADVVAQYLAMDDAIVQANKDAEILNQTFAQLDAISKQKEFEKPNQYEVNRGLTNQKETEDSQLRGARARGVKELLTNKNLESLTQGDVQSLQDAGIIGIQKRFEELFGGAEGLEQVATAAGFESGKDFINSFEESLSDVGNIWDSIDMDKFVGLEKADQLGANAAKQLQNTFDKIDLGPMSERFGKTGKQDLINGINEAISTLDPDKQAEALNRIAQIDFGSTANGANEIAAIIRDLGGNLDITTSSWQAFNAEMRQAAGYIPNFDDLISSLGKLQNILNSLKFGETIDEKGYQKLLKENVNLEDSFQKLSDGSYRFIGSLDDMNKATMENAIGILKSYKQQSDAVEAYKEKLVELGKTHQLNSELANQEAKGSMRGIQAMSDQMAPSQRMVQSPSDAMKITETPNAALLEKNAQLGDMLSTEEGQKVIKLIYDVDDAGLQEAISSGELINELYDRAEETTAISAQISQERSEELASAAQTIADLNILLDMGITQEAYDKQASFLVGTAEDAEHLYEVVSQLQTSLANLSPGALDSIKEQFGNCADEVDRLQAAIANNADETEVAARDLELKLAAAGAEIAAAFDMPTAAAEGLVEAMKETNDKLAEQSGQWESTANAAKLAAQRYERFNEFVIDMVDNVDDTTDALKEMKNMTRQDANEFIKTSKEVQSFQKSVSKLTGVAEDLIDADMIKAIDPDMFAKAARGDVDAIQGIIDQVSELQAIDLGFDQFDQLQNAIDNLNVGDAITGDIQNMMQQFADLAAAAGWTAEDIAAYFSNLGIDFDVGPAITSLDELANTAVADGEIVVASQSYDAEVTQQTDTADDASRETDWIPNPKTAVSTGSVHYATGGGGNQLDGFEAPTMGVLNLTSTFPGVQYSENTQESDNTKQETTFAKKLTNGHKGGGGNVSKKNSSGGGGGGRCFTAGTLVATINGQKNIEDIEVGDIVLSYNENLNKNEYSKVLQTMIHETEEEIYTLYIENDKINATGAHPFFIVRNNIGYWINVSDILINDLVLFADGTLHKIKNITVNIIKTVVYNLEVSDNHNYYIGINKILVHNKGGGCFVPGTLISTINGKKNIEDIHIGDIVLSYNENLKINQYNEVLQTMIHSVNENIYTIQIENECIEATGIHPFYIKRNNVIDWIIAENLEINDLVLFADGTWHKISNITFEVQLQIVYNLEVADNHNYYVGNNQILVHNKGGRRRCFVAGTLISMQDCQKNIENVQVGDIVLSYNEQLQQNEYNQVLQTMVHETTEKIYTLNIENEIITVTGTHPFYINRNNIFSWINVADLVIGDKVLYANGTQHDILSISFEIKTEIVYNLEVSNNHNYYVGLNQILVHNKGGGGGRAARTMAIAAVNPRKESTGRIHDLEHGQKKTQIATEKLSKTIERVYGKRRVDMMKDVIKLQGQELNQIKELNKLKEQEYKDSIKRLQKAKEIEVQYKQTLNEQDSNVKESIEFWKHYGLEDKIQYDEQGYISNLGELQRLAAEVHNSIIEPYNGQEETEATKNLIERENAIYSAFKDLTGEIDETWEAYQEGLTAWEDKLYEIHDQFAEMLEYKLQVKIELVDGDLKIIDTKLKNIGDSIYKSVEALTLLWNSQNSQSQYRDIIKKGDIYSEHWDEINEHYDPAKWQELDQLTQQAYLDQAGEVRDGLLEQAEALIDLRAAYEQYYGDTLSKATEEIEKYTKAMEHNANILAHLQNLLDLTGKQFDYISKDTLIRGQLSVSKDQYESARQWAELQKLNAAAAQDWYEYLLKTDELGAERYKKEVLDKAVDYAIDAEEQMYNAAEEYAGHLEELWENTLNKANDAWEKIATMGDGWDYLSDSMERAKAIQEEYLTTTNKLYETNTLLRKLDKDMNNANNQISKDKLASFAKEVEQAQISNKLAKSSMEILKARYELLQAEMALEDAKDAKAIVRLQRDNEGNYGYVYTADPDKQDDAEQNLADKENDLYNLVLGYQNDYQEKTMESRREFQEAYSQIWQDFYDGRIATAEERERKLAELKEQYSELWKAYDISLTESEYWLNQVAATDVSEAWAHSYQDRRSSQQDFMQACKEAHDELDKIMVDINQVRDELTKDAALGLNDIKQKTDTVTASNKELAKELQGDVQPKLENMIVKVMDATAQFEAHAREIQNNIDKYLELAQAIQNVLNIQSGMDDTDYSVEMAKDLANGDMSKFYADSMARGIKIENAGGFDAEKHHMDEDTAREFMLNYAQEHKGASWEEIIQAYSESTGETKELNKTNIGLIDTLNNMSDTVEKVFPGIKDKWAKLSSQIDSATTDQKSMLTKAPPESGAYKAALKNAGIVENATGGYTGSWGNEGKLAILHEKELVLNASDTENILNTVEILRGITSQLNLRAGLEGMMTSMITPLFSMGSESLQQEVHITAEFPNVQDRNEIEEAFKTLVNEASQYANRY